MGGGAYRLSKANGCARLLCRLWRDKTNKWRKLVRICAAPIPTSRPAGIVPPAGYGAPFPCEPHHFPAGNCLLHASYADPADEQFLGWTLIGWVAALVWSAMPSPLPPYFANSKETL
jgi:hypothetical protein